MAAMQHLEAGAAEAVFGQNGTRRRNPPTREKTMPNARITEAAKAADHGLAAAQAALEAVTANARHLAALAANPLIAQLDDGGLGLSLKPAEVDAVLVLVRGLEEGRTAPAPQPQMRP